MLSFFAFGFAAAGAIAATGPVIIHLLNRRRFRVVNWAAMDFLREAMQRNRKILEIRDILLLVLRTLCLLLFGLAMARPYLSKTSAASASDQQVHAVLLVDNSLSMGYAQIKDSLLDRTKVKAKEYIDRLPAGSRISVLPLCSSASEFSRDAYGAKEDAIEALEAIKLADRSASAASAIDLAIDACQRLPELPTKRVVYLGDQQLINWPQAGMAERLKQLPELQIVEIPHDATGQGTLANTWISGFELQDGIADTESQALFVVSVRHIGPPQSRAQVTLNVDGHVSTQSVDLEDGQTRELRFPYRFDTQVAPGRPVYAKAEAEVKASENDYLPEDNKRFLVAPVVSSLPVLFVDQYGTEEKPKLNQYGETFRLRRLLAGRHMPGDQTRPLVQVRQATIEDLSQPSGSTTRTEPLQDARMVVVAGVESPTPEAVKLLREYVLQGGQLVIAAGAKFNPEAWNRDGWLDGAGILPCKLNSELIGKTPEEVEGATLRPFRLSPKSMSHDYFLIAEEGRDDLYLAPYFFKAIAADASDAVREQLLKAEIARVEEARQLRSEADVNRKKWADMEAKGKLGQTEIELRRQSEARLAELEPTWLTWQPERRALEPTLSVADRAKRTLPQVLASYDNNQPFMVERSIGKGQVILVTTGVQSSWNNLTKTYAVVIFERILRSMLERTMPRRNRDADETLTLAVDAGDRRNHLTLTRPGEAPEPISVEALGADTYGVSLRDASRRGIYRITAYPPDDGTPAVRPDVASADAAKKVPAPGDEIVATTSTTTGPKPLWEVALAVNGSELESDLTPVSAVALKERLGDAPYRWISGSEEISLEGAAIRGQNFWKWLMFLVLVCLLAEIAVLVWPMANGRAAT